MEPRSNNSRNHGAEPTVAPTTTSRPDVLTATKASPQRRARLLTYLAVAAVVVAGGAVWGIHHHSGSAASTEARGNPSFVASTTSASPSPASVAAAAPCASADLKVSTQPSTFGMNSEGVIFSVTNTGSSECGVPDHVTDIHGQEADGTYVAINNVDTFGPLSGTTPGPLGPGETAMFSLTTGNPAACPDSTNLETFDSIGFAFGTGASLTVALPTADTVTIGCGGVGVSQVGVSSTGKSAPTLTAPTGTDVEASRTLPQQVPAGSSMSYTVTLTNDSLSAVSLSPCPSYVAYMAATPGQVADNEITGSLNCDGQSSIPAGGSISFDLNIKAPTQTGLTKIGWWVTDAAFTAQTGGAVTVTQ